MLTRGKRRDEERVSKKKRVKSKGEGDADSGWLKREGASKFQSHIKNKS